MTCDKIIDPELQLQPIAILGCVGVRFSLLCATEVM